MCPDFHGARHLGRPSGCYQFPRTSFRSFVIVALGPATTTGLLTAGEAHPYQHRSGPALNSGLQLGITERLSCLCSLAHQPAHSASVLPLLPRACRLRSHPATDYLQGDGPLSLPIALPDRLPQITYAIRVKALLVSHRTYRVRTHSGFFRALFVAAAVFRGSPSLFGIYAGACIAI